jgi:hypothetical protein
MNLLGGIAALGLGTYITSIQIKKFRKKEQDNLGWDIRLLAGGIMFIIIGIAMILKDL